MSFPFLHSTAAPSLEGCMFAGASRGGTRETSTCCGCWSVTALRRKPDLHEIRRLVVGQHTPWDLATILCGECPSRPRRAVASCCRPRSTNVAQLSGAVAAIRLEELGEASFDVAVAVLRTGHAGETGIDDQRQSPRFSIGAARLGQLGGELGGEVVGLDQDPIERPLERLRKPRVGAVLGDLSRQLNRDNRPFGSLCRLPSASHTRPRYRARACRGSRRRAAVGAIYW